MYIKAHEDLGIENPIPELDLLVEEIPDLPEIPGLEGATEIEDYERALKAIVSTKFQGGLISKHSAATARHTSKKSVPVTIRLPVDLLAAFKLKAGMLNTGYQTLIIEELVKAGKKVSRYEP
jgi:predicted DNA binding CopG/RHH family protein